jgi:hypothetical protein
VFDGDVIEGGECCADIQDGCGVCGFEPACVCSNPDGTGCGDVTMNCEDIGDLDECSDNTGDDGTLDCTWDVEADRVTGPGLAASGNCDGDEGCAEFTHNKTECEDIYDGTCVCSNLDGTGCTGETETGETESCADFSDGVNCGIGGHGALDCDWDARTCYWGAWDDCSGSAIIDCDGNIPYETDYIGDQGIFGFDECGICDGDGAIYGNANCCEIDVDECNNCYGPDGNPDTDDANTTGYASPTGVEDDGSIYCDCDGNVEDCTGECGGEGVVDCSGTCNGTDFSCLECDDTTGECVDDSYGNLCYAEQMDVCGMCYGEGVLEGTCDCFGNITTCAGVCPFVLHNIHFHSCHQHILR